MHRQDVNADACIHVYSKKEIFILKIASTFHIAFTQGYFFSACKLKMVKDDVNWMKSAQ